MYRHVTIIAFLLLIISSLNAFCTEFVIIYPILHPFFSTTSQGARDSAEKHPEINLTITAPINQSSEEQIKLLEGFINRNVDAIAIGPVDENLTVMIDQAVAKGIPVICFDTDAPLSTRSTYIGTDNYKAGYEMGNQVLSYLSGDVRILISVTSLKTQNMNLRVSGFRDAVAKKKSIKIVAVEEGMAVSDTIFQNISRHIESDDFDVIVTMDAESGPMIVRMWKAWGLDHPVFCFDDPDLVLEGLRDRIVKVAIIQNQYEWGEEAITAMINLTNGKTVPGFIDTGIRIVTPDSVAAFRE